MKLNRITAVLGIACLIALSSCYYDNEEALYPGTSCDTASPTYSQTISPIISSNCLGCHSGSAPSAGLLLDTYANLKAAVQSKNLQDHLVQQNGFSLMPPAGMLSNCKIDQVNAWVQNGMPEN
jgi:cytochrome c5